MLQEQVGGDPFFEQPDRRRQWGEAGAQIPDGGGVDRCGEKVALIRCKRYGEGVANGAVEGLVGQQCLEEVGFAVVVDAGTEADGAETGRGRGIDDVKERGVEVACRGGVRVFETDAGGEVGVGFGEEVGDLEEECDLGVLDGGERVWPSCRGVELDDHVYGECR